MLPNVLGKGRISKKKKAVCFLAFSFITTLSGLISIHVSKSNDLLRSSLELSSMTYNEIDEVPMEILKTRPKKKAAVVPPLPNGLLANSFRYVMDRINKQNQAAKDTLLPSSHAEKKFIVWIASYWRSGSTFLGDYLQHFPASFYLFEPFHAFGTVTRIREDQTYSEAWRLMDNFVSCNFAGADRYLNHIRVRNNTWLQNWSQFRNTCSLFEPSCYNPTVLNLACSSSYMHIIKTVRLPLTGSRKLLLANPNLRIIHLVRDPRAIMNSRMKLAWCQNSTCANSKETCADMRQDIEEGNKISQEFPERYYRLQFEKFAEQPNKEANKLFSRFGWPKIDILDRYLDTHTKSNLTDETKNAYSTYRKSQEVVNKWQKELNGDEVFEISNNCYDVLKLLNLSK